MKKTVNSKIHNWLIHDIYVRSLRKLEMYISGTVLDVGCGLKPYKLIIDKKADNYFGIEYEKTLHGLSEVDIIGNAQFLPVKTNSCDTVISFQVMEHIKKPLRFLTEIRRVLKPGGYCLLMTPFIWGEHEAPYDFFRYTKYGLKYLGEEAGLKVIDISADTGFWTTSVIRFNYYIMQFGKGPLRFLINPLVWGDQFIARFLDKIGPSYETESANYTSLFRKPLN